MDSTTEAQKKSRGASTKYDSAVLICAFDLDVFPYLPGQSFLSSYFSLISHFTPVSIPISCKKHSTFTVTDFPPVSSICHRTITLTYSIRCHPDAIILLSPFHLLLSSFLFHSCPLYPLSFRPPQLTLTQSPPLPFFFFFCSHILSYPPYQSANYSQIKMYTDSLMNPDTLNAAWAHSCY